jgi:synaptobrevin family protein YKT6
MVKLTSIAILKYNGADREPYLLGFASDLSTFGYFQRGTVKEMLTFVSRTVARKTQIGQRQTVQQDEYYCHAFNKDGLVGIAFVDHDYPARAGFCVVNQVLEEFTLQRGEAWRGATADAQDALPVLETALTKYQVWAGHAARTAAGRRVGGRDLQEGGAPSRARAAALQEAWAVSVA